MEDLSFYNLYNNSNFKINHDDPISTLKKINRCFCSLGIRASKREIDFIKRKIKETYDLNKEHQNLKSICDCISTIQLHQIFFDGNHRTSYLFFKLIMHELVPEFNYYASPQNNEFDNFFKIYYHDDDMPSEKNLASICKYIKKEN